MNLVRIVSLTLLGAALLPACSADSHNPFEPGDGGPSSDLAGVLPGQDAGTLDGPRFDSAPPNDDGGPMIVVTEPVPNPASPPEVPNDTLTVKATITAATIIDAKTVTLSVPVSGSMPTAMSLVGPNVYQGTADISQIPSGQTSFQVSAADLAGRRSGVQIDYVHDHGPTIIFTQPTAMSAKGSSPVQLVISDPLHPIDLTSLEAGIRSPTDITLTTMMSGMSVVATGLIDFSKYTPVLDGLQLIRAQVKNSKGTLAVATKSFTVDNQGPMITINKPVAGSFVGGVVTVDATVTDPSGVNDATVVAVFGGNPMNNTIALQRTAPGGTDFQGVFDVRSLGTNYVSPVLSIRADDQLGNHSELAEEIIVDNEPPILSLDPPLVRVSQANAMQQRECSQIFDPVGAESANDGDVVKQVIALKARVNDTGNWAPGTLVIRYSGMLPDSVVMWLIPALTGNEILAVDTNKDGVCDDVNPLLMPASSVQASNQAVTVQLKPLASGGTPDFRATTPVPPPWNGPGVCDVIGDPSIATPPVLLCTQSGTLLTYVLPSGDVGVGNVSIWSIPPIKSDPYDCIGLQFDSLNRLPEGPACAVVRGVDNAGNQNVSAPLRICIDRGGGKCVGFNLTNAPNCTGTYMGGMTTGPACTPLRFAPTEVHRIDM